MTQPLFLQEAIDARRDAAFGEPLSARQPGWGVLSAGAMVLVAMVVGLGMAGQFTRKEHVTGYLMPTRGLVKVYAPQDGTVAERRVVEGQTVRAGDVLLVVSSDRATESAVGTQAAVLDELRRRRDSLRGEQARQQSIDALELDTGRERQGGLDAELEQARRQLELQTRRVASAERVVRRHESLLQAQYVSEAMLQTKHDDLLDAERELASLRRTMAALTRDKRTAALDLEAMRLKQSNARAAAERGISEIEQQLAEAESRRSVALTAPTDGTVTTILADVGQAAHPQAPLLSILPAGADLQAHLLVPTRAAGFVQLRQTVALRYHAFPFQRFGHHEGIVVEVGRSVIQPGESSLSAPAQEPVYLLKVQLPAQQVLAYGQGMPLRAGMTLDADVRIERRRLIDWLFDPVRAVARRL